MVFVTTIWAYKPNLPIIICLLPASTSQSSGLCCQQDKRLTVSWGLILPNIFPTWFKSDEKSKLFLSCHLGYILLNIFLHRPWLLNFAAYAKKLLQSLLISIVSIIIINIFHWILIRRLNCSETDHRHVSGTVYITKSGQGTLNHARGVHC